jgi:hypothetical protein
MFRKRQLGRALHAIVACTVAYALALNIFLAGALGAQALAANGQDPGAFEICLSHNGNSDQESPAQPAADQLHCVLCVVGVQAPILPHLVRVTAVFEPAVAILLGCASDPRPLATAHDPGKPPRGPPLTA